MKILYSTKQVDLTLEYVRELIKRALSDREVDRPLAEALKEACDNLDEFEPGHGMQFIITIVN